VSAPILDTANRVTGAVAFSVPVREFQERRWALERTVRAGAARFSRLRAIAEVSLNEA
jgi:DNA-binding IclR family transcriptional regulator